MAFWKSNGVGIFLPRTTTMILTYTVTRKDFDPKELSVYHTAAGGMKMCVRAVAEELLKNINVGWLGRKLFYWYISAISMKYVIDVERTATGATVTISFPLLQESEMPFVVEVCRTTQQTIDMKMHIGTGPYSVDDGKSKKIYPGEKGYFDSKKDKNFLKKHTNLSSKK